MSTDTRSAILVALDFSDSGDVALTEGLRAARRQPGTELHVVHVVTRGELDRAPGETDLARQEAVLAELPGRVWSRVREVGADVMRGATDTRISVHVRLGVASEAIAQAAVDYDADVIIVGTHGRSGMQKLLLGSVAEHVLKIAHCPVLVARTKDYSRDRKSDRPEPPRSTSGATAAPDPRVRRHAYSASETVSWTRHDSNVVPTGISW